MIYLAGNNSNIFRLAGRYPLGLMMSPAGFRSARGLPFALDNGLFHKPDDQPKGMKALPAFYRMLDRLTERPMFVTVPDVPYDGRASLELSRRHLWHIVSRGLPAALAVQDGMVPGDIPPGFGWLFVAGSTEWKWSTAAMWVREGHARGMGVHIARVNTWRRINQCIDIGADSADGTGIWRGDKHQLGTVLSALIQPGLWGQRASARALYAAPATVAGRIRDSRGLHAA